MGGFVMDSIIVANGSMLATLKDVREFAKIFDAKGHIIGFFTARPRRFGKKAFDLAEIERRKRSKEKGEPLKVIMGRLRLLEKEILRREKAGERKLTGDEAVAFVQRLRRQSLAKKRSRHQPTAPRGKGNTLHRGVASKRAG
jgi:hypothetical protein